ncbi:Macrolide export ATP-binding/permease protein MacB [compost metagenome]
MLKSVQLLKESFCFALKSLYSNKTKTFLSLLGVSVGIFLIVAILTVVDSLSKKINKDIGSLDNRTMFFFKYCFGQSNLPNWKIEQFPNVTYEEYKFLKENLTDIETICFQYYAGKETITYNFKSISAVTIIPCTYEMYNVEKFDFKEGRFFNEKESNLGYNTVVIGSNIANSLFEGTSPINKYIRFYGQRFRVIGVLEKIGDRLINIGSNPDTTIYPTVNKIRNLFGDNTKLFSPIVVIKPNHDIDIESLKAQITYKIRNHRGIKSGQENNFFINLFKGVTDIVDQTVGFLKLVGWIISGFSLLVGGFGIANIMIVSVKMRTSIIGIQKALGAKNRFILFQFLFEAIILSVSGGVIGIFLVWITSLIINILGLEFILTFKNTFLGISLSTIIGLIFGILPAYKASKLNPVESIRIEP